MALFDRTKLKILPLSRRKSKSSIEAITIDPDIKPPPLKSDPKVIHKIAEQIVQARKNRSSIIISFGAHLIKNGLGLVLRRMVEGGFVTHFATNGAGSIHDWEFAFHGKSEEDVRTNVQHGTFGIWEETGNYINLALLFGASRGKGYGESIGELIHVEKIYVPDFNKLKMIILDGLTNKSNIPTHIGGLSELLISLKNLNEKFAIRAGELLLEHPFKRYSIQEASFKNGIPFTVHPGFGYDIIYSSPFCNGAAIGRTAEIDWLRFVDSISKLEGGIYISIGSAIMSPMIFEKALSMARNTSKQEGKGIKDFMIVVNDIQDSGDWQWGAGKEPPKDSPAYYLRFCKTFDRMGAREMHYVCEDNRTFMMNLYHCLKNRTGN